MSNLLVPPDLQIIIRPGYSPCRYRGVTYAQMVSRAYTPEYIDQQTDGHLRNLLAIAPPGTRGITYVKYENTASSFPGLGIAYLSDTDIYREEIGIILALNRAVLDLLENTQAENYREIVKRIARWQTKILTSAETIKTTERSTTAALVRSLDNLIFFRPERFK